MGPAILLLLHEVRILVRVPPTLHLCDGCAAEPSVGPLDVDLCHSWASQFEISDARDNKKGFELF